MPSLAEMMKSSIKRGISASETDTDTKSESPTLGEALQSDPQKGYTLSPKAKSAIDKLKQGMGE